MEDIDVEDGEEIVSRAAPLNDGTAQYIRAIKREDGITDVYKYTGKVSNALPVYKIKRTIINPLLHLLTDDRLKEGRK